MSGILNSVVGRRAVLGGAAIACLGALPGCATLGELSFDDAIRRLLQRASTDAFARLTSDDGFWNSTVARIGLPDVLGSRGATIEGILASALVREQLQRRFNRVAEDGARRAAPVVADAVRTIGTQNAMAILKGGPQAATAMLRGQIGTGLVPVMVPALGDALRVANDPVLSRALSALSGVDINAISQSLAVDVDNAIWNEIGVSEAAIRANPEATGDPVLIAALKAF